MCAATLEFVLIDWTGVYWHAPRYSPKNKMTECFGEYKIVNTPTITAAETASINPSRSQCLSIRWITLVFTGPRRLIEPLSWGRTHPVYHGPGRYFGTTSPGRVGYTQRAIPIAPCVRPFRQTIWTLGVMPLIRGKGNMYAGSMVRRFWPICERITILCMRVSRLIQSPFDQALNYF